MDYKKILSGLLSTAYKLDQAKIDAILDDAKEESEITTALLDADKTRVGEISKPKPGQTYQDGYKKAKAEVLDAFETSIKEKYGVTSDLKGDELIADIVKTKTANEGGGTLTDDQVRKHPLFIAAKAEVKTKETEWQKKYDDREASLKLEEGRGKAKASVLEILDGMKPVLPGNATAAQNQKSTFANLFNEYEFSFVEGSKEPVISKNGTVLLDAHQNSVTLEGLVKQKANEFFEFQNNNGGGNSGNNGGGDNGGGTQYPAGITKPKTYEDLTKIIDDANVKSEDKQIVMDTWEAENKQ